MRNRTLLRLAGIGALAGLVTCSSSAPVAVTGKDVAVSNLATQVPGDEKHVYEPVIAINPLDPDKLVAFTTDLSIYNSNPEIVAADRAFRSTDGGKTWIDMGFMRHPRDTGVYILGADPTAMFDAQGNAYFAHLFRPNDAFRSIYVFRSTDSGATWQTPVAAFSPERWVEDGIEYCTSTDKEWLSPGAQAGELLLVHTMSTFRCELGEEPTGLGTLAAITDTGIYLTRSRDYGQTWSPQQKIHDGYSLGAMARAAPDGTLYVAQWSPQTTTPEPCPSGFGAALQPTDGKPVSAIVVVSSRDDGATWTSQAYSQCSYDLADDSGAKRGYFGGGNSHPAMAVDTVTGIAYVVYPTLNPVENRFTLLMIASADRGLTWSPAVEVTPGVDDARMPRIIARGGRLYLAYMLTRADGTGDTVLRRSTDGGATWSEPTTLSSARADFSQDAEVRDYIDMDLAGGRLAVIWTDARDPAQTQTRAWVGPAP
jgi:hypothetical protein